MDKKKCRRIIAVLIIIMEFFIAFFGNANLKAATYADINNNDVFLKQQGKSTCTLVSAAMMMRRAAILSGNSNWDSITESSLKSTAWINGTGLRWSFSYNGISVESSSLPTGNSNVNKLIELLNNHPEGIVIHYSGAPHAVLLTDYTNGTFYCAEPLSSKPVGRIPLSQAYKVSATNATRYWFVSYPNCSVERINLDIDTRYPTPFKCYPANNTSNTAVYYSNGEVESGRYISPGDDCTINQVYTNGLCEITYPSGNSYRNAYAKLSDFITNGVEPYNWSPSYNVNSYKLSNRAEVFGSVFSTDSCKVVGGMGDLLQIIYPVSSGYKLGWVEAEKVYTPPVSTVIPGPVVAGFFNGKEVVVMSPKRIDLGGSSYIAEGDICIIRSVDASNGYCTVTYPSGGNNVFTNFKSLKDATLPVSELIGYNPDYEYQKVTAQNAYAVYPTAAMTSTVAGSVTVNWTLDAGDEFYTINKSGGNTEVMYYCNRGTHEGYWKIGWINIPYYALDVNGSVDGTNMPELTGYAYADVKVNGIQLADNITDYWNEFPCGSTYEISDIQTCNGYIYQGIKDNKASGVITGDTDVRLIFKKEPVKCTGIVVKSNPSKIEYIEDEVFDKTGLNVVARYSDDSEKDVTSSCKISGYDSKPGVKTVKISYSEYTSALTVNVTPKKPTSISIVSYPDKTDYYIGEEFDETGLKVKATYDNNTSGLVSDYDLVYDYSSWDTEGKKKIGIAYGYNNTEVFTSFEVNVSKKYVNSPKLTIPEITCKAGDDIAVPLKISGNPGIASLKVMVEYDKKLLELKKIEYNSEWDGMSMQPQKLDSPVILNWFNGAENYRGNSTYAILYFKVLQMTDMDKTTELRITYDEEDIYNIDEENVGLDIESNKIKILSEKDKPTATPTAKPTATPTVKPTATPTVKPTATPTVKPTATPTAKPTATPTAIPESTDKPESEKASNVIRLNEGSFWDRLLKVITFGIYEPDITVIIESSKKNSVSIYYYVDVSESTRVMTIDELDKIKTWRVYKGEFMLSEKANVVYAKIIDNESGDIEYICSDGIHIEHKDDIKPIPLITPEITIEPEVTEKPDVTQNPVITEESISMVSANPTAVPVYNERNVVISNPVAKTTPLATIAPKNITSKDDNAEIRENSYDELIPDEIELYISSIKKNTRIIKGKVSIKGTTVKIKIGNKKYKKAKVKGKSFSLHIGKKLKKNARVIITVSKKGYISVKKICKVK